MTRLLLTLSGNSIPWNSSGRKTATRSGKKKKNRGIGEWVKKSFQFSKVEGCVRAPLISLPEIFIHHKHPNTGRDEAGRKRCALARKWKVPFDDGR